MNLDKKITQIFSLIFLCLFIVSCDDGCVEADEFDTESVTIKANPTNDGVTGSYDEITGGQKAEWHDTGLKTDGNQIVILISGGWIPWFGDNASDAKLTKLSRCNFCAKSNSSPNCICYNGKTPAAETSIGGTPVIADCSVTAAQNDPSKCTCTKDPQYGGVTDLNRSIYHFPLNAYEKDGTLKIADKQSVCKYDRGMGAYIALFGSRGVDVPKRVYHLFSETEVCNVKRDSANRCLDAAGNDLTKYLYKSADEKIFMKDNRNGNEGVDPDSSNDEYHKPKEIIKVIIFDRYYSDNYGQYNLTFMSGMGTAANTGLIEFMVGLMEDIMLGVVNQDNGKREGGIVRFMYQSIVQDSGFVTALQVALSLYIALFGAATLFGVAEVSRKEISSRIIKIGMIMFFTSNSSWNLYNDIVVGFFKDSMDYVVGAIMDLSDKNTDQSTTMINAQMDRNLNPGNATRFSYVDLTIKKLLSQATAKKIFGLFFGTYYGLILIPAFYALIGYYIYSMLLVAQIYVINLIKIIFVLALGPIFMCFSLFSHTQQMFKNWLAFLGGRSLEILILFMVLYNFLILIDKTFVSLLSFRACTEIYDLKLFTIKIINSYIGERSFFDWITLFMKIAALITIMMFVVDKIGELSGKLISIGDTSSDSGGTFRTFDVNGKSSGGGKGASEGMAHKVMGAMRGIAGAVAGAGLKASAFGARNLVQGATYAARQSGLADKWNSMGESLGFRGIRTRIRDSYIDAQINKFSAEAKEKGMPSKEADAYIRRNTMSALQQRMMPGDARDNYTSDSGRTSMILAGVDSRSILKRLDQKLVRDPMKKMFKEEERKIKAGDPKDIPIGKSAMMEAVRANVEQRMLDRMNFTGEDGKGEAKKRIAAQMKRLRSNLDSASKMDTTEAAKLFADDPEMRHKYLEHLKDSEFQRRQRSEDSIQRFRDVHDPKKGKYDFLDGVGSFGGMVGNALSNLGHHLRRDVENNPRMAQENFTRKSEKEKEKREKTRTWGGFFNPLNRFNALDKAMHYRSISTKTNEEIKKSMTSQLAASTSKDDLRKRAFFQKKMSEIAVADFKKKSPILGNVGKSLERSLQSMRKKDARDTISAKDLRDLTADALSEGSTFDKAAKLSYLHKRFKLGGKDPSLLLAEQMRDKFKAAAGHPDSKLSKEENAAVVREMSTGLYGDDKAARLFEENLKDVSQNMLSSKEAHDPSAAHDDISRVHDDMKKVLENPELFRVEKALEGLQTSAGEELKTDADRDRLKESAEAATKAADDLAQRMKDDADKPKDPTAAPDSSNPKPVEDSSSQINSLSTNKAMQDIRLRISEMNKKMAKYELNVLKSAPDPDHKNAAKIKELEDKIDSCESEITRFSNESERLESEINALKAK
jgi:type IV secretory pathway VirB6-like protein